MKTKLELYGTFGPSNQSKDTLKKLFQAGMTGLRLNLSHSNLTDCNAWLDNLHAVSEELHIAPDLLVDLQGAELRIGNLSSPLFLQEGTDIRILKEIPLPSVAVPYLKEGQIMRLDDGKIIVKVKESGNSAEEITGEILSGGTLTSKKSLSLDSVSIELPALSPQDIDNLKLLHKYQVTGVMLPFVRSREDLLYLKKVLLDLHLPHIRIFAKIENQQGVEQLPSLLPYCDQIVIARGDLGNAYPLPQLPAVQKKIARTCFLSKKPFMVVNQLLASMENHAVPTRAEVNDIFNAVADGASSLMLTNETAVGHYPVEAMQVLSDTASEGLRYNMNAHLHR